MLSPAERCELLEKRCAVMAREIAELQEQLKVAHDLCEIRDRRLRAQMDGTYAPEKGTRSGKTPKDACPVAAFHRRKSGVEI